MTDRLIIADARKVSSAQFFRAVFGIPEPTEAEIAERRIAERERMAELTAQHEREMMGIRQRMLALFTTEEGRAAMLATWAAEGVDVTQLTECQGDPIPADRRAA